MQWWKSIQKWWRIASIMDIQQIFLKKHGDTIWKFFSCWKTECKEKYASVYWKTDIWDDILMNQLRVMNYELLSIRVAFMAQVKSYFYCTSNEFFCVPVKNYCHCTSYELFFTYKLQITVYSTSWELRFTYELRVTAYYTSYELLFIAQVKSYILHTS